MKKTKNQIKQQINALTKMKPRVLHYSGFGDDHHAAIDAQIHVLEEQLTTSEIYDLQSDCQDQECSGDDGIEWHIENIFENALEAAKWLSGEEAIKPTDNWKTLVDLDPATIIHPPRR